MLLDDIIAILSDSKGSLTDALLKTKVFLHQIGRKELATWVTNELTGYPTDKKEDVPEYRHVGMHVHGHVVGHTMQHFDYPLPILHLAKKRQESLTLCVFAESIANIEAIVDKSSVKDGKKGQLQRPLPVEFGASINRVLTPGTHVVSAWCEINMLQVENIVTQVRSRLLDFMLELKGAVGDIPDKELIAKAKDVPADRIFYQTIYHSGGTLVIGSENVQVNNKQGDVDGLLGEISKLGYDKDDLEELRKAIKADGKPDITEGETSKWYMKALKKAKNGMIDFGADVVTKVMVEVLKHYTGG